MNTTPSGGGRLVIAGLQASAALALPFLRVSGESALRFDLFSLKLYFFGSVFWISEFSFFILVFLLFFTGFMLFIALYGRIWCEWGCPQTVLSRFARSIEKASQWFIRHRPLQTIASQLLLLLFSAIVSANLIGYFVSPYELYIEIANRALGPWTVGSWGFLCVLMYVNLAFLRGKFCGAACPCPVLQRSLFRGQSAEPSSGLLRMDEGRNDRAVSSGTSEELASRPVIGEAGDIPVVYGQACDRPRITGLALALAFLALLFAYQLYVRVPVDFLVFRDETQLHHQVGFKGNMMNAYYLTVENHSLKPETFRLLVSGIKDAELVIPLNPFPLPPNSVAKIRVYILARRQNLTDRVTRLNFTLENTAVQEMRIVREAPFVYSDRSDKGIEI